MQSRKIALSLSILSLAVLTSVPARAAAPYTTGRFSVTFPDGWQMINSQTGGDSVLAVLNVTMMSYCYMTSTTTDHPMTAQELEAALEAYAGSDSISKVTDGTKNIGGKSFTYVEYKTTDTTTAGPSRIRLYYSSNGTNLFTTVLIYDPDTGAGAVADLETALATLTLSAAPIRAWSMRPQPKWSPADHDVLGRSRPLTARTRLYRLPLP
jgi:hypothetical protein